MKDKFKFLILIIFCVIFCQNIQATANELILNKDIQVCKENKRFGLCDLDGEVIVKPEYTKLIRLGETGWITQKRGRFGLISSNGEILVKPKYRNVSRYWGTYAKLGNDNDFGIYNDKGEAVVEPEYSSIEPLYGKLFLICKKYKYGVINEQGVLLLPNIFDDIYMPTLTSLRLSYGGEWYEISKITEEDLSMPDSIDLITINNVDFKLTHLISNTSVATEYSAITTTDYVLKIFSSLSPAYEETIDDLMFSKGADGLSVFMKMTWIPMFPFVFAKKYYMNFVNPYSGPLSDLKIELKRQLVE
ncbi:MAG: WG repeat-containing protein [Candidatus Gastranaerophilales bacterium]